jgi:hypothetical protein
MALERIWGLLLHVEFDIRDKSLFGIIHDHPYAFSETTQFHLYEEACVVNTVCKTWKGR